MDSAQETILTDRQRYWLEHIQACEASGKTVAEYATGRRIEVKAMYAGKKVLVKKGILPRTQLIDLMVGREGFEPWTIELKARDLRPI